jgi:hypothetical protein
MLWLRRELLHKVGHSVFLQYYTKKKIEEKAFKKEPSTYEK